MQFRLAIQLTLLIMLVQFHNSEAQENHDKLGDYIDELIKNKKPDDNIIVGDNIENRVQTNGKTTIHYNGKDYVQYWNKHENPDFVDQTRGNTRNNDNIISGNNISNRVQHNGRTIQNGRNGENHDQVNGTNEGSPKTEEALSLWQRFINLFG